MIKITQMWNLTEVNHLHRFSNTDQLIEFNMMSIVDKMPSFGMVSNKGLDSLDNKILDFIKKLGSVTVETILHKFGYLPSVYDSLDKLKEMGKIAVEKHLPSPSMDKITIIP